MGYCEKSCEDFLTELAGKAPVPGGGGASALVGAVGMALGSMVGSLTLGKKKYQDVEEDIRILMDKAEKIRIRLIELVDEDAVAFEPLSKAYGLPKNTPEEVEEREKIMAEALLVASEVPLSIMEQCCKAIDVISEFADKGSRLAISDAGVAAACAKAALCGASFNVYINTASMKDEKLANELNGKADSMIEKYGKLADETYDKVMKLIRK